MPNDMELIVEDRSLRRFLARGFFKRLPHVHYCKPNTLGFSGFEPLVEEIHTFFRAVLTSEPDRTPLLQVAYHDPVDMPFADRNFVNSDHLRVWFPSAAEFLSHVLLFEFLDRFTIKMQFLCDILNCGGAAPLAYIKSKALGIERIVCKKIELLLFHLTAPFAENTAYL